MAWQVPEYSAPLRLLPAAADGTVVVGLGQPTSLHPATGRSACSAHHPGAHGASMHQTNSHDRQIVLLAEFDRPKIQQAPLAKSPLPSTARHRQRLQAMLADPRARQMLLHQARMRPAFTRRWLQVVSAKRRQMQSLDFARQAKRRPPPPGPQDVSPAINQRKRPTGDQRRPAWG